MKNKIQPVWLLISCLAFIVYLIVAYQLLRSTTDDTFVQDLRVYAILLPVLFLLILVFRKINVYKLAFIIWLIQTVWAVLSPTSFFEVTIIEPIFILWIPSLLVAWILQKRGEFKKRRYSFLLALLFTYLFLPVTTSFGYGLYAHYKYIIPLYF